MSGSRRAAQGLATLALLKVNFDRGNDHIEMFMPFVLDSIVALPTTDFGIEDARSLMRLRHELNIPESVLSTLLARAVRRGYVQRRSGRYLRVAERLADVDIGPTKQQIDREHANVAQALRAFAAERKLEVATDEEALALILRFFEQFHVPLLIDTSPSPLFRLNEVVSRRESALVARFLESTFRSEPARTEYVTRMLEGFVLQNALLLKDIGLATRRFKSLFVYLDTGFVLRVLGLAGEAHSTSTRETLDLLKATGAEFGVFEKTIEEIERILRVYERKLASSEGTLSLRPTDVTRHLIANHYTPSDVATAIALLRQNLGQLGIAIRGFPKREAPWTADENALTQLLKREDDSDLEPRITHDVDCVAAILTARRGLKPQSLDDARAVFATTSSSVVRTVREWFIDIGARGVPPVVHAWPLSNAAWLKKPSAATTKKLHELVALCSAALRPSPKAWKAFLTELKRLEKSGEITSSERVALVARELAECRLGEVEGDGDVDAKTIGEVVDRARAEAQERTARAVAEVRSAGEEKLAAAEAALAKEQTERRAFAEEKRQQDLQIRGRIQLVASLIAKTFFVVGGVVVAAGVALGLPGGFPQSPGLQRWAGWTIALLVAALSVMNLVSGTYIHGLRVRLQAFLEQRGIRWLTGRGTTT